MMGDVSNSLGKKPIFIGTTEIAGYYNNLAKGLDELGINYKYVQLSPNSSGFGSQSKLPFLVKLPYLLACYRLKISVEPGLYTVHKTKNGFLSLFRFLFYFFEFLLRAFVVLPWAMAKFDIFCFGARSNIVGIKMGYWDIALLKRLGKRIICVYHGSDSRPPYINGSILHHLLVSNSHWDQQIQKLTEKTKKAINKLDRLADVIIVNPYSAHFHQKPFVNWFMLGAPYFDAEQQAVTCITSKNKRLRILHAPTHRIAKGSPIIQACVKDLQRQGFLIDLVLIHGKPHTEVIEEIKKCDFVIDELYSDALMAGFAVEASYYGKAVIACGYVSDENIKQYIPTYYCRPEALREAVIKFINEPEFREALGARARAFVRNEWSYLKVAERYVKIFSGDIPKNWYVYPNNLSYLHGFGMEEGLLKQCLFHLIEKYGKTILHLADKPELETAFLDFSNKSAGIVKD